MIVTMARRTIAGSAHRSGVAIPRIVSLALTLAASTAGALDFQLQVLPGSRREAASAWHDVDGDGRKDFVRQDERRLMVHLLGEGHRLAPSPDWTIAIEPPWDLWTFADVRPESPGEELLALSPRGVGWTSFQRRTSSTAQMDFLVTATLPLEWDERRARPGYYAIQLAPDRPVDLLLPTRSDLQIYRRHADTNTWEVVETLAAPLRPSPRFWSRSSQPFLMGFGDQYMSANRDAISSIEGRGLAWRSYGFRSRWSASAGWLVDWNGDGRLDWMEVKPDRRQTVHIYLQTPEGRFDRDRPIIPPRVSSSNADEDAPKKSVLPSSRPRRRTPDVTPAIEIENLVDVNGDGRLDFVRFSTVENWSAPKTRVSVYLQTAEGAFQREPDYRLRLGAVVPTETLPLSDVDGDGDLDLLLLRIDLQIASVDSQLRAFLRKGIDTYLGAHLWSNGEGFAKRPAWEALVVIGNEIIEFGRNPNPLIQFDRDLTGDGRPDLLLQLTRRTIAVFPFADSETGFQKKAAATLEVPFRIDWARCRDYDGDGRADVLVSGWEEADQQPPQLPRAVFFGVPSTAKAAGTNP